MDPDEHHELHEALGLFALNKLEDAEQRTVQEHVDRCRPCRRELDDFHTVVSALQQIDPTSFEPRRLPQG